ncbi:hypothetical protein MHYP_G00047070 [Metynnis hypsauchen]
MGLGENGGPRKSPVSGRPLRITKGEISPKAAPKELLSPGANLSSVYLLDRGDGANGRQISLTVTQAEMPGLRTPTITKRAKAAAECRCCVPSSKLLDGTPRADHYSVCENQLQTGEAPNEVCRPNERGATAFQDFGSG